MRRLRMTLPLDLVRFEHTISILCFHVSCAVAVPISPCMYVVIHLTTAVSFACWALCYLQTCGTQCVSTPEGGRVYIDYTMNNTRMSWLAKAYVTVKSIDPYHVTVGAVNCADSWSFSDAARSYLTPEVSLSERVTSSSR